MLPTSQTYSDGTVVKWDEPPADDSEPERPAPVVELAESSGHGHGHGTSSEQPAAAAETDTTDDTARLLGGAGLVLGALGLGFGVGATLRARKAGRS